MTGATLLRSVVAALDESGVPFMLTGSLAAAFYGAGRATLDIDLVIDPNPVQLRSLVQRLEGQGAYVSQEAADEALADRSMFNVVDTETGWKADLIVRKRRLYSETEFALPGRGARLPTGRLWWAAWICPNVGDAGRSGRPGTRRDAGVAGRAVRPQSFRSPGSAVR
jgi:hypothetical protein